MTTAYCDAILFTGEAMVEGHALLADHGVVADIVPARKVPADARKIACDGLILAPGFIDAQANGGGGVLLNNAPTAETCLAIARTHRAQGTTRLLPTCLSDEPETMRRALAATRAARQTDAGILGVHLEGPCLSGDRRGVHKAACLHRLGADERELYRRQDGEIMLVTLAPECASPDDIAALAALGIRVALGHTAASPGLVRDALAAGAAGFTHLFNGMGGIAAREPGVAGVALDDRDSWCGLIADGHHVSAEMIRLALRAKPPGKVFLVSDAMPPAGCEKPEPFLLYGAEIRVENGRCVDQDGKLAGSSITLLDAARHCIRTVGVELEEALRMASLYPADFLGIAEKFGKLLPGYAADIVALTPELDIKGSWLNGEAAS